MSKYFAKIGLDNVVARVHVVTDSDAPTEAAGVNYLIGLYGHETWKMCSKTGAFRAIYPGNGYYYNSANDIFHQPRPVDKDGDSCTSWTLSTSTGMYDPPITQPELTQAEQESKKIYRWDESLYQSDNTKGWLLEDI